MPAGPSRASPSVIRHWSFCCPPVSTPAHQRLARFLRFDEVRDIVDLFSESGLLPAKARHAASEHPGSTCSMRMRDRKREDSNGLNVTFKKLDYLQRRAGPRGKYWLAHNMLKQTAFDRSSG